MKVGIFTDAIDVGPVSIKVFVEELITNLLETKEDDIEIVLIHTRKSEHPLYKEAKELLIPVSVPISSSSSLSILLYPLQKFQRFLSYRQMFLKIKESKIDLLHLPDLAGLSSPPSALYFSRGFKIGATIHGLVHLMLPPSISTENPGVKFHIDTYKYLLKWKMFRNKMDFIVTVSEDTKEHIYQKIKIDKNKIHVIYHGVDPVFRPLNKEECYRELKKKFGIEPPFILHVSAYQPKKNVRRIIEAFGRLENVPHKLVIAGPQPENLKEFALRLGLKDRVIFTGPVEHRELPILYSASDAFVFPSLHESFGMPIVEAMACGCPVITSNVFAMPEIAGDAALLVNPYSVEEIARAIYKLMSDEHLRIQLKEKGLSRAKQFSWKKCAKEYMSVYRETIENNKMKVDFSQNFSLD